MDMTPNADGTYSYDTGFLLENLLVEFKLPPGHQFRAMFTYQPTTPTSTGEQGVKQLNPERVLGRQGGKVRTSWSFGFTGEGDKEYQCFAGGPDGLNKIMLTLQKQPV